ncbi:MAG: hypothetical protein AAFO97_14595 [Pseudomonadota bacterium]
MTEYRPEPTAAPSQPGINPEEISRLSVQTAIGRIGTLILAQAITNAINRVALLILTAYGLMNPFATTDLEGKQVAATGDLFSICLYVVLILAFGLVWSATRKRMEQSIHHLDGFLEDSLKIDTAADRSISWETAVIEFRSMRTATGNNRRTNALRSNEPVLFSCAASLLLVAVNLGTLL